MDQKLIKQLEDICSARGVRLTPQRKRVYELICESNKASSAYELLDLLKVSEPQAKPPTVYRALDFLLEQGLSIELNLPTVLSLAVHLVSINTTRIC
ncbi:zinc uptake regulation protein ZUR [Vibrio variabilis]|uniref:Zinc uptake regulation protein ZUR n=1 Tax=Vibrio variabilis TaxID=990271 RepID=A0ABQ0JFB3_9VIBR|nr:zinc uptake regulation protein ZUR [Vibrio variabilis]